MVMSTGKQQESRESQLLHCLIISFYCPGSLRLLAFLLTTIYNVGSLETPRDTQVHRVFYGYRQDYKIDLSKYEMRQGETLDDNPGIVRHIQFKVYRGANVRLLFGFQSVDVLRVLRAQEQCVTRQSRSFRSTRNII